MTKGLTGIPSLAYLGVNAGSPPNIKMYNRAPTQYDYQNFIIGDLWINTTPTPATLRELYMLVAVISRVATWIKLYPISGGGGGNLRSDDLLIEAPDPATDAINVYGGEPYLGDPAYINMYTNKFDPFTLYVNLKRSINQPNTNATATEGMYKLGSSDFMHNFGTNNTALGHGTLNLTLTTAVAKDNTAIGHGALNSVVNAFNCTAAGSGALTSLEDGQYVTALGFEAGKNLTGADSDDIMIGSPGVLGDLNCIRIGQGGVGANQQDKLFIPAVWEGVAEPGVATGLTLVNANGKMYVDVIDPNSVLMTDAAGNPIGVKGAAGTVLTGHGVGLADPAPEFLPITSAAGTVTISTDPITGSINLEAAGVAGLVQLTTDTGVALPLAGNINVLGGELINTDNLVANTVTVNLDQGTDGTIIVGNTGAPSEYKSLISSDGSISVDFSNPFSVDLKMVGIPPVGGVNYLMDHASLHIPPISNGIQIEQGANITTVGDALNAKITVSVTDNVDLPLGHMYCRYNVQTSAGSLEALAGHLLLPNTSAAGTAGTIRFNNVRWIHNYGRETGAGNTFVGERTGNITLTPATSIHNLGLGYAVLENISTSQYNCFGGFAAANALTTGSNNSGWGRYSLRYLTTGNRNLALGAYSGFNYTGAESDNILIGSKGVATTDSHVIRIGIDGTGDYQQNACYIAGIYGYTPGPSAQMAVIGSDGKLGTAGIPSGGATKFVTDSGTATVSGTTIQVKGGANINTTGSSNIVTVNLDTSIRQPYSATSSNSGFYSIGSTSYSTDRFLHAWTYNQTPPTNIYAGYQAGNISTSAIGFRNVGIGYQSMDAVTSSNTTTSLGYMSHSNLTSGSNSIALGANSGLNYTTESNNITLGHRGVAADSRVMRLGYDTQWNYVVDKTHPDGVFTKTVTGIDSAYVYGIYNSSLDSSALPVYVDKTGKVGTDGSVMFSFRQTTALSNVTGDGTVYSFGTSGGITIDFDNTTALSYDGSGNLIFTAPYPGKYKFTGTITMVIPASPPVPRVTSRDPLWLVTSNLDYIFCNYIPASTTSVQYVSEIVTAIVYLDRYDTARWACSCGVAGQTKNISIAANVGVSPVPVGVTLAYGTHFLGYKIA